MATARLTRDQRRAEAARLAERHESRVRRTAFAYILPAALVMLLITFWPLIYQLWMSFTNYSNRNLRTSNLVLQILGSFTGNRAAYNSPEVVGLSNYITVIGGRLNQVLSGFDFWRILLFNLVWTFVNLFFHVSIGVAVALLLNQEGLRLKRFYRALYIIPWAMPGLVSAMIWRNMFDDQSGAVNKIFNLTLRWLQQVDVPEPMIPPLIRVPGWVNPYLIMFILLLLFWVPYLLRWVRERWLPFTVAWIVALELFFTLGLPPLLNALHGPGATAAANAVAWFGMGNVLPLSFFAVLITNVWLGWPFMMAIATGALQSIPRELYEAAEVDGATGWQSFWRITAPLIRPAMIPAIMIGMMLTFNQFNVLYFVSGGAPLHSTEILVTQAYRLVNETTINLPGLGNVRPYGIAASFAYIVFAILATLTLITNRISRATEAYSD